MSLTVIILTKNESKHIRRALTSVRDVADRCIIVDSGSTDSTVQLALDMGASVLKNDWVNYANQFNWALDQLADDTDWVLRLDADEYLTDGLRREIKLKLPTLRPDVNGVYVSRRMNFLGKPVKRGGIFPTKVIRLFRSNRGKCEDRWMDEHIIIDGKTARFEGEIIDDNLNSLTWWTDKHNGYASREVVDILNFEYKFNTFETIAEANSRGEDKKKRWIKERIYMRLPGGVRAFLYVIYRLFFRLGFFDSKEAIAFHVLQGFWYRYLVDMKLLDVKRHMAVHEIDVVTAIKDVLEIDILPQSVSNFNA